MMPIVQFIPVSVLLSVLITFGLMNKHYEIIALRSVGAGMYYLLRPMFIVGAIFFIVVVLLSEVIVPLTKNRAERIWSQASLKKTSATLKEKDIWIKGERMIAHLGYFNSNDRAVNGITLHFFEENFLVTRTVDAAKRV